jgi:hypothetical protein
MPFHIPRLRLPNSLAGIIAALIVVGVLWNWREPHPEGISTIRIGFCIEERQNSWSVFCAKDRPPDPNPGADSTIQGTTVVTRENIKNRYSAKFRIVITQRASAVSAIEYRSANADEARATAALEFVRADLAAAAERLIPGIEQPITNEPAQVERTLWTNLWRYLAVLALIGPMWWILGRPGHKAP